MTSNWREATWGELATLEYGKALRDYKTSTGSVPVYGTNGPIGWTNKPLCPFPTVIIGRKGAYRGVHLSPSPCWVIDTAFYISPKQPLDIRWAYYQLLTQDINGMDSGSAIPSTSREEFYRLPVKVPPLAVQKQIADVLGTLDSRIANVQSTNICLESIGQAIFKSWFVDFDPVRAKAEGRDPEGMDEDIAALFPCQFEESGKGLIPKGWRIRTLDSIASYLNGLALQKYPPVSEDQSLPVIKIKQLKAGNTEGADRSSNTIPPDYVVQDGDVLFSWSGSLEVEIWCGGPGALNQHIFKVTSNEVPKWYYYLAIKQFLPMFREIAASKATTMGHIQRHHLKEAKIALPPPELLRRANAIMEPLIERRILNSLLARQLSELRDTLLPRLISGKLRVPEAEEALKEVL